MKEHIRYSYSFGELTEAAQAAAIDAVREARLGLWWDSADNESIGEVITYDFAESIGEPGRTTWGVGDYPGIPGVKLDRWACNHVQGDHVGFKGTLTRENAPALPWVDGIGSVSLAPDNYGFTRVTIETDDAECICDPWAGREPTCEAHETATATDSQHQAMREAIDSATTKARRAAYDEIDYIGSEESVRELIDVSEYQFNDDGSLFA